MKPVVRILIVTDDGVGANGGYLRWADQSSGVTGVNSREFHLGEFMRVLHDTTWLGFNVEITKAHRSPAGKGGLDEAALKADRGADIVGFRFNQPFTINGQTRKLADYDMALFFAIYPANPNPSPELTAEAEAVAQFMENGGGFFATGDHANLGSELCGLIPRVRSMRRWWASAGPNGEPAAPPPTGLHRHDTTRPGTDNLGQFEDQSDEIGQEIIPKLYNAGFTIRGGYPAHRNVPHPLLCSPEGMVSYLPDHMHEGWCEVPDNLAARTFILGNTTLREYPDYMPPNPPPGYVSAPLEPEVVATGEVLPGITTPALDPAHPAFSEPAQGKTFGVIGAWDGHRVNKGRVVVDSTWHHFFDINLTGDRYLEDNNVTPAHEQKLHGFYVPDSMGRRVPNDHFRMIMWYYRNIIYWLIPAGRLQPIWWQSLYEILKRPQLLEELSLMTTGREFDQFKFGHYVYFGQLAEAYLTQARGACSVYNIHPYLFEPKIPWWEWIQDHMDVWSPIARMRVNEESRRDHLLGAWGVAPRLDVAATLTLGAAMVTAAYVQQELLAEADSSRMMAAVRRIWPLVLKHALSEFGAQLDAGAETHRKLQKVIAGQLRETR